MIILFLIPLLCFQTVYCSIGDSSPHFEKCIEKCHLVNCTKDGTGFVSTAPYQPLYLKLLLWDCDSECKYDCMWKTTDAFLKRKWRTPQFFGKWPFIRIAGIQEPASFLFSFMNLYNHIVGFKEFRRNVRSDAPFFWMWHIYIAICVHAWTWSCIFHCRDFPLTEYMDYTFAFSLMLSTAYFAVERIFYGMPRFLNILITTSFLTFFVNHAVYLSIAKVDYGYNMKLNTVIGALTVLSMFLWSFWNKEKQPYLWKCGAYFTLSTLAAVLELSDFPPLFWTVDSHALWHLGTAIILPLFYSWIIEDCKYLKKNQKIV